jgi:transposase-like protein
MPSSEPMNWQPISQLPLVASMIDGALSDTADHIQTLTKARARPHVLDDATIDRVERVHGEQLEFVDLYAERVRRWRAEGPSATQRRELDRLEEQNRRLRQVTTEVLALAAELRKGTVERIMAMSDFELGLQALLGTLPPPHL